MEQLARILPPVVRAIMGPALNSVASFGGLVCGGYFDLGIVLGLLALVIALATIPASEIESGFADLVLARPFPRHWIITRTIALVVLAILLMLAIITGVNWLGMALFAPFDAVWPAPNQMAALAFNLAALLLCWSGIALAFAAVWRRGPAAAVCSLLAFATLLLDYAQRLWAPLKVIAWVSPFHYFNPFELVMGEPLRTEDLIVLWAVAMTGYILAYLIMSQRDITR